MFLRHVHSSSRYDRSVASLIQAAKRYKFFADIITWTEVEHQHRELALHEALPNWRHITGDKSYANDCGISFRPNRFGLKFFDHDRATDSRYPNVKGMLRDPAYATYAVLEDLETGDVVVVAVVHLASSVEGDLRIKRITKRTISWTTGFIGVKRRANRLKKAWKADGVMLVADWNVDFKQAWVRALVKAMAPSYRVTWTDPNSVEGGTHGRRLIDATLLRGRLAVRGSARLMRDDKSSDHRPYRERLFWKKRRQAA